MNYEREPANMKEMGPKAYKQKIDKGRNKNLPYNFDRPIKGQSNSTALECKHCNKVLFVNERAVLVVCGSCSGVTRIKDKVKR